MNGNFQEKQNIGWGSSFGLGALIGAVIFIGVFGLKVLDVTNDDFLYRYEFDLTQHYLGWRMFRNSGWHFPIGLCDTNIYPYYSSVVYTDSIPLFAVIFKVFSPILPDKFQYFGIFGMICFMLQGGMAKLLIRRFIKNEWICNIGAVFFISTITFVQRMFWQTALSAHFLLLMGIALFVYRDRIEKISTRVILWCGLGALTISIHFYLYGMISVMLACFALLEAIDGEAGLGKSVLRFILYLVPYLAITVLVFYLFGGFYGTINVSGSGNDLHNAGINALFEPKNLSIFFKDREYSDGEKEGLCYLGVALSILFVPSIIGFIKSFKAIWQRKKILVILTFLLGLMFYLFALSPIIMWGDKFLFSINFIPAFIQKYSWGIFRACGRFMWPVMYAIILFTIVFSERLIVGQKTPDRIKTILYSSVLAFFMCIQLFEFSGYYKKTYESIDEFGYLPCPADVFYSYDMSQYNHIQFMQFYEWVDYYSSLECFYEFVGYSRLAMDTGMTVSNFHFSRDYDSVVQEQIENSYKKLLDGEPDKDTLYVFPKEMYEQQGLKGVFKNVVEFDTGSDIVLLSTK